MREAKTQHSTDASDEAQGGARKRPLSTSVRGSDCAFSSQQLFPQHLNTLWAATLPFWNSITRCRAITASLSVWKTSN